MNRLVIARSDSDEAIQSHTLDRVDCFVGFASSQ